MRLCYLYLITLPGGKYVGISCEPKARWQEHQRNAINGVAHPLYRALRKYGVAQVKFEVLCSGSYEAISALEIVSIALWRTRVHCDGYNISLGGTAGTLGTKASAATRRKMSGPRGPHTPEWTKKIADARRGKLWSTEARIKAGESQRKRKRTKKEIAFMTVMARRVDHSAPAYKEKLRLAALARWARVREQKAA